MSDTLREKLKDALRNYRYGSGATLDGSADAICAIFAEEREAMVKAATDSAVACGKERDRAEAAEARCAKLVEYLKRYCGHDNDCPKYPYGVSDRVCRCGLDAALAVKGRK